MSEFIEQLQEKRNRWVISNKENDFEDGIRSLLTELYPDNAHFIYELLQNAEDVDAQKVKFELQNEQLIFTHNGKILFSGNDIEAITNIGKGTKKDDVNKIGKFGVGFKSVFSYTQSPSIYSGEYSFKITDLVVPEEIEPINKKDDETVFVFPFNNEFKTQSKAYNEIKEGLSNINRTTLLFLNSISEIEINISNESFTITKYSDKDSKISRITNSILNKQTKFLIFSKPLPKEEKLYVSIAFKLINDKKTKNDKLATDNEAKVSIYFPAEKETSNLKFHIHAPFASTVARDSIKDRPENKELIDIIADLLCEATEWIKGNGLLTDDFIRCLPIDDDNISDFYKPIQLKIIDLFNTQPYLLCDNDKYHPAKNCWQSTKRLKAVIATQDLKILLKGKIDGDCFWLKRPYQRNASGRVYNFLKSLEIKTYSEDNFEENILSLSEHFIENPYNIKKELKEWDEHYGQYCRELSAEIGIILNLKLSNEKVTIKLFNLIQEKLKTTYRYFSKEIENIIKANYSHLVINELLVDKDNYWLKQLYEILFDILTRDWDIDDDYDDYDELDSEHRNLRLLIRLKNGQFNFSKSECYFPSETRINSMQNFIVDSNIYDENLNKNKTSKSKRFLKIVLGVKEIAIDDEVLHILRKYEVGEEIEYDENIKHIKLFLKYFKDNKSNFNADLFKEVSFLINSDEELSKPINILIDKPIEETSLSCLADEKYRTLHSVYFEFKNNISQKLFGEFLVSIGCNISIPIKKRNNDNRIKKKLGNNERQTDYGQNENYYLPISLYFEVPEIETSLIIWNEISKLKDTNVFDATYRANGSSKTRTCDSDVIETLRTFAWIPDIKGVFYKPEDITTNNLHKDFSYNDKNGWLTRIGFGQNIEKNKRLEDIKDDLKEYTGFGLSTLEEARKAGVTEEEIKQLTNAKKNKNNFDLKSGIQKHNREIDDNNSQLSPSIVKNTEKYREKIQQQYYKNITRSENKGKSYNYSKKVKVGKNETIEFLKKQYQGHCQICGFTFSQSGNKGNYFELFDWLSEKISKQESSIIDAGSSLSLCSRCHSVLKYGDFGADFLDSLHEIENSDYTEFAEHFDLIIENEDIPEEFDFIEMDMYKLPIRKLKKEEYIFYSEEHFVHFHNVLTLNENSLFEDEEKESDKIEVLYNDESTKEVAKETQKVVDVGDIITVKYNSKKPFKLKIVSIVSNIKNKNGIDLISISSPFGKKVKGRTEGYIFEMGKNIVKIISIDTE